MVRFSERNGFVEPRMPLQIIEMPDSLRNTLWNAISAFYLEKLPEYDSLYGRAAPEYLFFTRTLWMSFLKLPFSDIPKHTYQFLNRFEQYFMNWNSYTVYDLVEFLPTISEDSDDDKFREVCNKLFEKELAPIRFIENNLVPISGEIEEANLTEALSKTENDYELVHNHLAKAPNFFSDREAPKYRTAAHEAVSALESLFYTLTGDKKSLGQSVKDLKSNSGIILHPAIFDSISKLYGFTSDSTRHGQDESDYPVNSEDARFIINTSSAIINYLIEKNRLFSSGNITL